MFRHGIRIDEEELAALCRRNHVEKLSFFGSFTRDDFGPDSDIDVLVEFIPGARVGLFELCAMEEQLSELCGGRTVQISTPRSLSKYFRSRVLEEAQVQYVG